MVIIIIIIWLRFGTDRDLFKNTFVALKEERTVMDGFVVPPRPPPYMDWIITPPDFLPFSLLNYYICQRALSLGHKRVVCRH